MKQIAWVEGFTHLFLCYPSAFFLYFLTLSLQWISFIHIFKRELKNHMGLLQVNTKNLCTFLYLWGVGRGRISFVLHFFLFERV
jgi:hypothetical protein